MRSAPSRCIGVLNAVPIHFVEEQGILKLHFECHILLMYVRTTTVKILLRLV